MATSSDLRAVIDEAWRRFAEALDGGLSEDELLAGWQTKEMLAHVAFWLETVPAFVSGAFRGDPSAFAITFPSGYAARDGDWPDADTHNAREALWARQQSADVVLERLRAAAADLRVFLGSVTDEEATMHADYFDQVVRHLDDHRRSDLSR